MTQTTHPPKERVREYLERHRAEKTPPISPEQARRELGWQMIKDEKKR